MNEAAEMLAKGGGSTSPVFVGLFVIFFVAILVLIIIRASRRR